MKAGSHSEPLPESWPALAFRGIFGLCLLIQLPLIWIKTDGTADGPYASRLMGLLIFLPLGIPLLFWKIKFPGWLQMGVAAGAAGGIAMIVGDNLDQASNGHTVSCCMVPNPSALAGMEAMLNWSNGLMLLACIISCILLCPRSQGRLYQPSVWLKHLGCSGGMWLGMILGGRLLLCVLGETFGKVAGTHIAMVVGMMAGAAISHMLFWRRRRPKTA